MSFLDENSGRSESVQNGDAPGLNAAFSLSRDVYRQRAVTAFDPGRMEAEQVSTKRRTCGNSDCSGGWAMPWRNRRRPVFEGHWGCSGRCVLAVVRAALRREQGNQKAAPASERHRHRVPLGLVMLAQGWITHPQLQTALAQQRASGTGRIGDWLVSECGLEAEQVTRGLSVQWGCPVLTMEGFSPRDMALVMPGVFVEEFAVLPLRIAGSRLIYLAWEDRVQASVAFAVERMSGLKAESGLLDSAQLKAARTRLLECDAVPTTVETLGDEDSLAARITAVLEQQQPVQSRLVRLHQYCWLRIWMESGTKGKAGDVPTSSEDMRDYIFTIGPGT